MRIPGMLYILFSFTPWIIYWILCGVGFSQGIIVSLTISIVLLIPQFRSRDFNIMDIVSIIYFTIAFTATFIFNTVFFVERSCFLGYLTLSIMALTSIIIRKPYTLQVSKRDYPEIYWKDRGFLLINYIITIVWLVVFIVNTLIYLLLSKPLTVILSNTLIAFGITFSIMFPLKAPAYFVSRKFKKYDWRVDVKPGSSRGEREYDIIVIGAGIGGLTCGALLSKRGYRVLVLEQHYRVGGYCSSFQRRGFVFNTGVENVSGLWEKGPVTYLLKELGLSRDELFVKNRIRYIFKGEVIDVDSLDEFIEALSKMFPEEEEKIREFFEEAELAYRECYREADVYGVPLPAELIVKVFGSRKLLNYPREHPHFYDWLKKTYMEKLNEYFTNNDLKDLLCALIGYVGAPPDKIYASTALTAIVSYYLYGGYYPRGGAQRFADTLKEFIEKHGGDVLVNHRVDEVLVENGRVVGVRVGDKVFKAPIIVSNVNAKTLFLELINRKHLDKKFIDYIRSLKMSPSCFMVFLGVNMDLSEYPTIIRDIDGDYDVVINSNADQSLAPKGEASLTILAGARYEDFPERGTREYIELKNRLAKELIRKVEKVIPGISKHVVVMDAATPKTFERYTSMPKGAIYSFDQSIDTRRPYFKTPIKGLYLVGASTFPGGGVEAVVISGIICAHDICGWR